MREVRFVAELPEKIGSAWKTQYYVKTVIPKRKGAKGWHKCQGYIMRQVENHPFANKRGYVPEHRLFMEERLGRFLNPRKELVHHINGDRADNRLSNLKLTSPIEHPKGHAGQRNPNGQFVAKDLIFQQIKIRLLNTYTGECRPYTLCELISTTYRRGQFEFRGRWTGLKDKNGRDVYEGDILLTDTSWHVIVRWIDESSKDMGNPRCGWSIHRGSWLDKCEVIGNIHEDSELLEEK